MNPELKTNTRALFLGPESENMDHVKELMNYVFENVQQWRAEQKADVPAVTAPVRDEAYEATLKRNMDVVKKVCEQLDDSCPFTKPTYMGHMCSDIIMASHVARYAAMLRNQNNVAYEASPSTTRIEFSVGDQLLALFGYPVDEGMIHLTCGGSIAVLEGYWKIRNIKSFALALGQCPKSQHLVSGMSEYELLSMPLPRVYELIDVTKKMGIFDDVRALTVRAKGMRNDVGHVIFPASKHYSHLKSQDVLGLGHELTHEVPVHSDYATDMKAYREIILDLINRKIPIMCATCIIGSTENGAFDDVSELVSIRNEMESKYNVSFPILVDAAYGGYVRSMLINEKFETMTFEECKAHWDAQCPGYMTEKIYSALVGMKDTDVVVVDPHKLGYVSYGAGAVCFRDVRILDCSTYAATYVFNEQEKALFRRVPGAVTLEGSRPGATAAAVYAAHLACPLNCNGYGQLMMDTILVCKNLEKYLDGLKFNVEGRNFTVYTFPTPDFHMQCWIFKEDNEENMEKNNKLNEYIYERCSVLNGKFAEEKFIVSSTTFTEEEYSEAPWAICQKAGYSRNEWERVQGLYALRSTCMNPWLKDEKEFDRFVPSMTGYFEQLLKEYINK